MVSFKPQSPPLARPAALLAMGLVSCENPADKTAAAKVKESVTKTTDTAAGNRYIFATESKMGFTGSKVTGSREGGFKSFTGHFSIKDGAPGGSDHKVVSDMSSTFSDVPYRTSRDPAAA